MKRTPLLLELSFILLMSACNLPQIPTSNPTVDLPSTIVALTLQAITSSPIPSFTPLPSTPTMTVTPLEGNVKGKICYPHAEPRPIILYIQEIQIDILLQIDISDNRRDYSTNLQPGNYIAYAWTPDYSQSGSYSECGMDYECKNATPLPFEVKSGSLSSGIDICDWTHGPYDIPYPPGFEPSNTLGRIDGEVRNYPFGSLPQLAIVAFNKETKYWYWIGTSLGQVTFSITEIPPGKYQIVAYDSAGHAGGVPFIVDVTAGQASYVIINDWTGIYPADPR